MIILFALVAFALVVQRTELLTPKEEIEVRFLSRAIKGQRACGIAVTRDHGMIESGVQLPPGPKKGGVPERLNGLVSKTSISERVS